MALGENFPAIIEAARHGSEWAWVAIYRELSPVVLGYLRARRSREPEDLTGEVFVQIVRNIPRFDGDEAGFRSWVLLIAHHRLVDERRRLGRQPVESVAEPGADAEIFGGDVEEDALAGISTRRVQEMLDRLSDDQREVLLLRIVGDVSIEDVSRILGKRAGAVKALQRRGLAALKKAISREAVPS